MDANSSPNRVDRPTGRARTPLKKRTLAQELADVVTNDIVEGRYVGGQAIPTEPELAEAFDVSRSVVRDAVRILSAHGLVDVQHGRGAFVTESPMDAVTDAFLLALRREHATAWDVEEFHRALLPDLFALAAENATDDEPARIRCAAEEYLEFGTRMWRTEAEGSATDQDTLDRLFFLFTEIMAAIVAATHNTVFRLLLPAVQRVRSLRHWEDEPSAVETDITMERDILMETVRAIESRDRSRARAAAPRWTTLPPEGVAAMKATPVGELVSIPMTLRQFRRHLGET